MSWLGPFANMFGKEYMKRPQVDTSSEFSSNSNTTGTSTPFQDPTTAGWREWLYGTLGKRAEDTEREVDAYKTDGLHRINQSGDIQRAAIERAVRSRGLGRTSMGGNAVAMAEGDRIGRGTTFLNTVPQFRNELEGSRLAQLQSLIQSAPIGYSTSGSSSQTGNQSGKQIGPSANWAQDLAQLAAYFAGKGMGGGGGF